MAGELATVAVRQSSRALVAADAVQEQQEQRRLIGEYVKGQMIAGTDYGAIPGTSKPTLLKPGAEKLTQLFRCVPRLRLDEKLENWDTGLFHYRFTCQIVTQADETVVAEGVGSASTYESRYRWRQAERRCPACGMGAIIKGKADFGGGWLCFKKKGGCGAKFADQEQAITSQEVGRVQNPDLLDQVNTVLKIAKKRALVDAALSLARCSDIFTQDVEDLVDAEPVETSAPASRPAAAEPAANPQELVDAYAKLAKTARPGYAQQLLNYVRDPGQGFTFEQVAAFERAVDARLAELAPAEKPTPVPPPPAKAPTLPPDVPLVNDLVRDLDDLIGPDDVDAELRGVGVLGRADIAKLPPTAARAVREHLEAVKRTVQAEQAAAVA